MASAITKRRNHFSTTEASGVLIGSSVLVLVLFGAFAVADFRSNIYVGIVSSVVGLVVFSVVLGFAVITVNVSQARVVVQSTVLRFRLANIALAEISAVTGEPFSKTYWGGWGLRLRGRHKAIVLKGTEAAVVEKRNGTKLYLAAEEAPSIANALARVKAHDI